MKTSPAHNLTLLSSSAADSGSFCTCYWPVLAIPSLSQTAKDCFSFCGFVLSVCRAAFSSHSHHSHKVVLTSDALFTIHTKLYSRQMPCSPFTQSCTHVRCLVHHSHKVVLTPDALFTIHTKLYSRQMPCSPFTQSCTHARCLVHHSHKAVLTPDALFTIHTKLYSRQMPCSPFTQSCTHVRCLVHHSHKAVLASDVVLDHSHKAVLTSDALFTIHTKLYSGV